MLPKPLKQFWLCPSMVSDPSKSWCPWRFWPQGQKRAKTGVLYDLEAYHLLLSPCSSCHSYMLYSLLRCGHFKTKSNRIGLQGAELLLPEVMTYVVRQQRNGDTLSMTNAVRQQRTEGVNVVYFRVFWRPRTRKSRHCLFTLNCHVYIFGMIAPTWHPYSSQ